MKELDLLKEAQRLWNDGDFYSAHEVLEDIWRLLPKEEKPKRNCYQGLIRLAIGYNHYLCGRRESSLKVLKMVYEQLIGCEDILEGIGVKSLLKKLKLNIESLEKGEYIEGFPKLDISA
ncbi:MAG: DUF309 domain-containing protein [Aquificaceae bacterium]